jgi:hypothetical protein
MIRPISGFKKQELVALADVYQKLLFRKEYIMSKPCA